MRKYIYNLLLVLIGAFLTSCGGDKSSSKEPDTTSEDNSRIRVTHEQFNAMKMEIAPLQEMAFDHSIKASGKIDVPPKHRAKVTSFIGGYLKTTSLLVGDKVSKGQALLTLESPEYIDLQQSYLEIAGQMEYMQSEYERQKTLFEEKISSQKKFLEAESNYKRAKATYESLKQKLNMLHINVSQVEQGKFSSYVTVYSPISGDVTAIYANVGMAVSSVDVIVEIVESQAMHLELAVFEKDALKLNVGQKVKFTVPQIGSQTFEAIVSQIGKSVEGNDRVVHVYATLNEEAKQELLTGMFVEAQLIADSRNALSVPMDAITTEEGSKFLLVLESDQDGVYTFRKVLAQVGERNEDWVEIIPDDRLTPHTKVLFKGVFDII